MCACLHVLVCVFADARAGARVRVSICLCVHERTRTCVGAHACALEGAGSRACVRALCMYDLPYLTI